MTEFRNIETKGYFSLFLLKEYCVWGMYYLKEKSLKRVIMWNIDRTGMYPDYYEPIRDMPQLV